MNLSGIEAGEKTNKQTNFSRVNWPGFVGILCKQPPTIISIDVVHLYSSRADVFMHYSLETGVDVFLCVCVVRFKRAFSLLANFVHKHT